MSGERSFQVVLLRPGTHCGSIYTLFSRLSGTASIIIRNNPICSARRGSAADLPGRRGRCVYFFDEHYTQQIREKTSFFCIRPV